MALVNCSECGREISNQAATCPGCGAPVRARALRAGMPARSEPSAEPGTSPGAPSHSRRTLLIGAIVGSFVLAAVACALTLLVLNLGGTDWWADPHWAADDPALASTVQPGLEVLLVNYSVQTGESALRSVSADRRGRIKVELNVSSMYVISTPLFEDAPGGKSPAAALAAFIFTFDDAAEVAVLDSNGGLIDTYTRDNIDEKIDAAARTVP